MKFILDKYNQAEKLNEKTPIRGNKNNLYNSKEKEKEQDIEEEYNDFEENISIGSNNWK